MPIVQYRALLEPDGNGGYGVIFPELPGCVSVGKDATDAARMAAEALALHIEGTAEDGPVPPSASLDAPLPDWLLEEPGAEQLARILVPVELPRRLEIRPGIRAAMKRMDARRRQASLKGLSVRGLIDEGRR